MNEPVRVRAAVESEESKETARDRGQLRALVLSGGGAKGVFESGALHAIHRIGLAPDVITGSSVGAINAVACAESERARRIGGEIAAREVVERTLTLWQKVDKKKIADLDAWGWRVALLSFVLVTFGVGLGSWAVLGRPLTESTAIVQRVVAALAGLSLFFCGLWVVSLWWRLPHWMRRRIERGRHGTFGPSSESGGEEDDPAPTWMRWLGLHPSIFGSRGMERALLEIVPGDRKLSDYGAMGLTVRLTRTNVRSGRTEISEAIGFGELSRPGVERGTRIVGDPLAIPAVLASAAFPVAFEPVDAERVYPPGENAALYGRIAERADTKKLLGKLFGPHAKREYLWLMRTLDEIADRHRDWLRVGHETELNRALRERFVGSHAAWTRISQHDLDVLIDTRRWPQLPVPGISTFRDRYFDGGILDNTPLSSALAALRDRDARVPSASEGAASDLLHEVFVVLLSPEPRRRYVSASQSEQLAGPALGVRALRLQAERRLLDDVRNAQTIDRLLAQGADVRRQERVPTDVPAERADGAPRAESWAEIFAREEKKSGEKRAPAPGPQERLARVDVTRVYPSWDLPWVLALDDRLGFHKKSAREFQARGCRDTLWSINEKFRERSGPAPEYARRAAGMMGLGGRNLPVLRGWRCQVEECSLRDACDRVAEQERRENTSTSPVGAGL